MQVWAFALLCFCAHAHWWESGKRGWETHKEQLNDMLGDWGFGGKSKQCHKEKRMARAATRDLVDAKAKADQCKTAKRKLESRLQVECGEPPNEIIAEKKKTAKAKAELQDERVLRVQLENDNQRLQQKLSTETEQREGQERLNAEKLFQAERKATEMDKQLQEEKQQVVASLRKISEFEKGARKCQHEHVTDDVREMIVQQGHSTQSTLVLGVCIACLCILLHRVYINSTKASRIAHTQIVQLTTELEESQKQVSELEGELNDELGGMLKMDRLPLGRLGSDFDFLVEDQEKENNEMLRIITIQCSGVQHGDVCIDILDNGCIVHIHRQPSCGVEAYEWRKRFQFRPSDGRFELREDQIALDRGYLVIVFRAYKTQTRVFRFPPTFDIGSYEAEDGVPLTFPNESESGDTRTEGDHGLALGRLEMIGTGPPASTTPPPQAVTETSGSAINIEDYDATFAAVDAVVASVPRVTACSPAPPSPTEITASALCLPSTDIEEIADPSLTSWIIPPDAPAHTSVADTTAGGDSA